MGEAPAPPRRLLSLTTRPLLNISDCWADIFWRPRLSELAFGGIGLACVMGTNASIAMESQCHRTLTGDVLSEVDLPVRCEVGVTATSSRAW